MSDELKLCELEETESYECRRFDTADPKLYATRLTVHVLECTECGRTCEHVNGTYPRCPYCSAVNVLDENYESQVIKNAENYKQEDEQEPLIIDGEELDAEKLDADGTCPNVIGQSSIDNREKLEADILAWRGKPSNIVDMIPVWLDRQAAITKRETSEAYEHQAERQGNLVLMLHNKLTDTQQQVDELTAERDEAIEIRDQACGDAATFKAERDGLKRQLENQAAYIAGVEDSLCRCESQLVRDGKDIDRLTAERDYLQKVEQIHVESFRKLEIELAECKAADFNAMRERIGKLEAENRELNMQLNGAPF